MWNKKINIIVERKKWMKSKIESINYIFLLSSASLCKMSCLMSSYSSSLSINFCIFFESISQAKKLFWLKYEITFFALFFFNFHFLIFPFNIGFSIFCSILSALGDLNNFFLLLLLLLQSCLIIISKNIYLF
jgi:hypothetical protein